MSQIAVFSTALKETYLITPWLLLVPLATAILIAKRTPAIIVLFCSSIMAGIVALIFQPDILREIAGGATGTLPQIKGLLVSFYGKTQIATGNAALDSLVSTRGMNGMLNTIWLIICAVCFGGAMTAGKMLQVITRLFTSVMKGRITTVSATVTSGIILNICTAEQYIAIILNGEMLREVYKRNGYESRLLSRSTEDSATVTSVLVPWNSCGMTQATVLGVATLTYLPCCIFNLVSPLMSILIAATGYKIYKKQ